MPELLYHPKYAWSLYWDLVEAGEVSQDMLGGYVSAKLGEGVQKGWLTKENRQSARNMLVFADRALLPGELDVYLPPALRADRHIDWWSDANEDLKEARWRLKSEEFRYQEVRLMAPALLEAQDPPLRVSENDLNRLLDYWQACDDWEREMRTRFRPDDDASWRAFEIMRMSPEIRDQLLADRPPGSSNDQIYKALGTDPKRHEAEFKALADTVRPIIDILTQAGLVAHHGIPTFFPEQVGFSPQEMPFETFGKTAMLGKAAIATVSLYFKDIKAPHADTLHDALKLRDNPSVLKWREKMQSWTDLMQSAASTSTAIRDIKTEIDDANGYIEGAKVPTKALSFFKPWMTVGIDAFAHLTDLHTFGLITLTVHTLRLFGAAIDKSVQSPERLQHQWVMLSTDKAGGGEE